MQIKRVFWTGFLVVFAAAFGHSQSAPASDAAPPDRMYIFGDSYSDIGEGYLDGNGPTAVAYLARRLGFELYPSTTAHVRGKSLDYAVSGAQSGRGEGHRTKGALLGYGMRNQVDDFIAKVRKHKITFDSATTLFFLLGGLNDGKLPDGTTAANESDEIRTLYAAGARRFAVALLTTEIPGFGVTGGKINPSLTGIPAALQAELPRAEIRLSHWGSFFDAVLAHPDQYGITNTTDACAGRAIFDEDTTPCAHPETYFYYHRAHPSTATHRAVGDMLYDEIAQRRLRWRAAPNARDLPRIEQLLSNDASRCLHVSAPVPCPIRVRSPPDRHPAGHNRHEQDKPRQDRAARRKYGD